MAKTRATEHGQPTRLLALLAVAAAVVLTVAFNALPGLPVVPVAYLANTPVTDIYHEAGEQVGWPQLTDAAVIDNGYGYGVDNDEQGTTVRVCRGLTEP